MGNTAYVPQTIEDLKKLIKIHAEKFYLNAHQDKLGISDEDYDAYVNEVQKVEKDFNPRDLIDWPVQLIMDNEPEEPLNKVIVKDNDLRSFISNEYKDIDHYCTLKYDGGAIKVIYNENGNLVRIQSTPDETKGIVRTEQFINLVPNKIDPSLGIKCIRGEVLVDPSKYGKLSRNKANGLINSTVNKSEIESECLIRWYKLQYFDGSWDVHRQLKDESLIPVITSKDSNIKRFAPAVRFKSDEIINDPLSTYNGETFQSDGIVVYSTEGIQGFKYYYTDTAITTVTNVVWNKQSNGGYAPVLEIEPIELDERNIKKVSANGVVNLFDNHLGVGAEVKVILANTTIPKVIEILKGSDNFNLPVCGCGYQLTENDIFGSTLKCCNKESYCIDKVNAWTPALASDMLVDEVFNGLDNIRDCIIACPEWFAYALNIDRWDPFIYKLMDKVDSDLLLQSIDENDPNKFKEFIEANFELTGLQHRIMSINYLSAFQVIKELYDYNTLNNIRLELKQ